MDRSVGFDDMEMDLGELFCQVEAPEVEIKIGKKREPEDFYICEKITPKPKSLVPASALARKITKVKPCVLEEFLNVSPKSLDANLLEISEGKSDDVNPAICFESLKEILPKDFFKEEIECCNGILVDKFVRITNNSTVNVEFINPQYAIKSEERFDFIMKTIYTRIEKNKSTTDGITFYITDFGGHSMLIIQAKDNVYFLDSLGFGIPSVSTLFTNNILQYSKTFQGRQYVSQHLSQYDSFNCRSFTFSYFKSFLKKFDSLGESPDSFIDYMLYYFNDTEISHMNENATQFNLPIEMSKTDQSLKFLTNYILFLEDEINKNDNNANKIRNRQNEIFELFINTIENSDFTFKFKNNKTEILDYREIAGETVQELVLMELPIFIAKARKARDDKKIVTGTDGLSFLEMIFSPDLIFTNNTILNVRKDQFLKYTKRNQRQSMSNMIAR